MSTAILITGFSHWGKSYLIHNLFNQQRFPFTGHAWIDGFNINFTVESQSNDDLWQINYLNKIQRRVRESPDRAENLFAAFCPTDQQWNNSIEILNSSEFVRYDRIFIFLLKNKFDHLATLNTANITALYRQFTSITLIEINADDNLPLEERLDAKLNQIRRELERIF